MRIDDENWSNDEWTTRVNYFNKPIMQFNIYNTLANGMTLTSSIYNSGGEGGGGGFTSDRYTIVGDVGDYLEGPNGSVNVDWLVDYNANPDTRQETAYGIATPVAGRSSRNNQNTLGVMSKLSMDLNPESKLTIGLDAVSYTHLRAHET